MDNETGIVRLLTEIRDDQRAARPDNHESTQFYRDVAAQNKRNAIALMIVGGIVLGVILAIKF